MMSLSLYKTGKFQTKYKKLVLFEQKFVSKETFEGQMLTINTFSWSGSSGEEEEEKKRKNPLKINQKINYPRILVYQKRLRWHQKNNGRSIQQDHSLKSIFHQPLDGQAAASTAQHSYGHKGQLVPPFRGRYSQSRVCLFQPLSFSSLFSMLYILNGQGDHIQGKCQVVLTYYQMRERRQKILIRKYQEITTCYSLTIFPIESN